MFVLVRAVPPTATSIDAMARHGMVQMIDYRHEQVQWLTIQNNIRYTRKNKIALRHIALRHIALHCIAIEDVYKRNGVQAFPVPRFGCAHPFFHRSIATRSQNPTSSHPISSDQILSEFEIEIETSNKPQDERGYTTYASTRQGASRIPCFLASLRILNKKRRDVARRDLARRDVARRDAAAAC